jgi:hypothetical protein
MKNFKIKIFPTEEMIQRVRFLLAGAGVRMRERDVWEFCNQWNRTGSIEEAASRFINNPNLSEKFIDKFLEALPIIKAGYSAANLC